MKNKSAKSEPYIGQKCSIKIKNENRGRIIQMDHDCTRLLIKSDDGKIYEEWINEVTLL